MRLVIAASLILSLLAGCGSKTDARNMRETIAAAIKARKEAKAAEKLPKPAPVAVTRQSITHITKPFLQIDAQKLGLKTFYTQVAQNGDYRTFLNSIKMSVTFNNGLITATRGFGFDLLSQGTSITPREMFAETNASKTYTRTQQQLEKAKKVAEISYTCVLVKGESETVTIVEIDYELVKFTETCRNSDRGFKNTYWVDDDTKRIWKSAQSIGQQAGFFITEVLVQ